VHRDAEQPAAPVGIRAFLDCVGQIDDAIRSKDREDPVLELLRLVVLLAFIGNINQHQPIVGPGCRFHRLKKVESRTASLGEVGNAVAIADSQSGHCRMGRRDRPDSFPLFRRSGGELNVQRLEAAACLGY
jgi:hypothetical protein